MKKQTVIKVVLTILLVTALLLFLVNRLFNRGEIKIDLIHQDCQTKEDCVYLKTHCSCDCGSAVNKNYCEFYEKRVNFLCSAYIGKECKMFCNKEVVCKEGKCAYFGEDDACRNDAECETVNCSRYSKPESVGDFKPYCVGGSCKCECRVSD